MPGVKTSGIFCSADVFLFVLKPHSAIPQHLCQFGFFIRIGGYILVMVHNELCQLF